MHFHKDDKHSKFSSMFYVDREIKGFASTKLIFAMWKVLNATIFCVSKSLCLILICLIVCTTWFNAFQINSKILPIEKNYFIFYLS